MMGGESEQRETRSQSSYCEGSGNLRRRIAEAQRVNAVLTCRAGAFLYDDSRDAVVDVVAVIVDTLELDEELAVLESLFVLKSTIASYSSSSAVGVVDAELMSRANVARPRKGVDLAEPTTRYLHVFGSTRSICGQVHRERVGPAFYISHHVCNVLCPRMSTTPTRP